MPTVNKSSNTSTARRTSRPYDGAVKDKHRKLISSQSKNQSNLRRKPVQYRIFLEALTDLESGWYGPGNIHWNVNGYVYGRGPKEEAFLFDKRSAVDTILDMQDKGYPAYADPPLRLELGGFRFRV